MAVAISLLVTGGSTLVGTVTVRATVSGVTTGNFRGDLYVDGALSGSSNLPLTFTLDTTLLRNGSRVLEVRSKYKGVTYKSTPVTVTVNNPAAASVTQSITAGAILDGTETWTATVSGIADIARVDFYVDGAIPSGGTDASSPYSYSLDTTLLVEGSHQFYVSVVQTNGTHIDSAVVSATVQNVVPAAPVNTVAPAITGTAQQGNILSVSTGTWTGEPAPSFSYQWVRTDTAGANPVNIVGATSATYTLASADVGSKIKARVTGTNPTATVAVFSALTATVSAIGGSLPVNTVSPTQSGTAQEGQTLTVSPGTWTGADSYQYQWYRCDSVGSGCVPIGTGATTYALTSTDVGGRIKCRVTAFNTSGSVAAFTALTSVVAAAAVTGTIPAHTVSPSISGTTTVGQTLTANPGTWTGTPTPQYGYQWIRCDSQGTAIGDITGQTSSTYLLHPEDSGMTVRVRVTAFNSAGQASVTSSQTAVIAAVPPPPPPPPPPTGKTPLGYLNYQNYDPPTNINKYGIIVYGDSTRPAGFTGGKALRYMTAITCQDGYNNLSTAECRAGGWALLSSSGAELTNQNYGGVIGDLGSSGYLAAWCARALLRLQESGADGLFIDDSNPQITTLTGGVWPAKYPNAAAYEAAVLTFATYVFNYFNTQRGLYTAYNTARSLDNNGSQTAAWWARIGPKTSALTIERWMRPSASSNIRKVGTNWDQQWDAFRYLHTVCQNAGTAFLPITTSPAAAQVYSLATFLLDYDGVNGANIWFTEPQAPVNPWISQYAVAARIGAARGAATKSGNVWTRRFAANDGGADITVTIDPVLVTASIT